MLLSFYPDGYPLQLSFRFQNDACQRGNLYLDMIRAVVPFTLDRLYSVGYGVASPVLACITIEKDFKLYILRYPEPVACVQLRRKVQNKNEVIFRLIPFSDKRDQAVIRICDVYPFKPIPPGIDLMPGGFIFI